jgi:uncharacterized protein YqjF (DUF2071 family)
VKGPAEQRTFLTAEWKNLLMLNYAVEPALLEGHVPSGTELDRFDGATYVSLIGFEFNRTQVMGHTVPFHQSFEEVNLRFYVRRDLRRGVVFIRELVPKHAVSALARLVYGEHYSCVPMSHRVEMDAGKIAVEFSWGSGPGRCSIEAQASGAGYIPAENSLGQFITEHYWGYTARGERTLEYQVEHPRWQIREAKTARFSGDAERYYGSEFAQVLARSPDSAFIAEGSAVTVFKGAPID